MQLGGRRLCGVGRVVMVSGGRSSRWRDIVVDGLIGGVEGAGLVVFPLLARAGLSCDLLLFLLVRPQLVPQAVRELRFLPGLGFAYLWGACFLRLGGSNLVRGINSLCAMSRDRGSLLEVPRLHTSVPLLRWRWLVLVRLVLELGLLLLDRVLSPLDVLLLALRDLWRNVNACSR